MRNTASLLFSILAPLLIAASAFSQEAELSPAQAAAERSRIAVDRALEQVAQQRALQNNRPPPEGLSVQELRKMQGADPVALAQKYQRLNTHNRPETPQLLVFISTSMPMPALEMLGRQAHKAGAVLVLRGLRDPLGTKGALTKTRAYMMPVAKTGAAVQIDPEAFGRYNVSAVPTFVMAAPKKDGCNQDSCEGQFASLVGDVTLGYALEYWSGQGGWVAQQADMFLNRLEGDNEK